MKKELKIKDINDTNKLAKILAPVCNIGTCLLLKGDLGAGKTTFTKFLLKEMNVKDNVSSPTFVIMKNYLSKFPIFHIDAYRLENSNEDLGFSDLLEQGFIIIEWPEYLQNFWDKYIEIKIIYINESERDFIIESNLDISKELENYEI